MALHSLRAAVALTAALTTAISPVLVRAQTAYEYKTFKQGLVVTGAAAAPAPDPVTPPPPSPQPALQLSTNVINFGDVATNNTETRQVLVSNIGKGVLSFTEVPMVTGDGAFDVGSTTCGTSLIAGADCLAGVAFAPTAVGVVGGLLRISTSAGYQDVTLSGAGVAALGQLTTALGSSTDFGTVSVGSSAIRTFRFTNTGSIAAVGVQVSVIGTGLSVGSGGSNTCGSQGAPVSLMPQASCQFDVSFTPTSSGSVAGATVIVGSSALNSPSRLDVTATGSNIDALLVTKAEYGGGWGADGNLTTKLKAICDGKTTCSYVPLSIYGSDPYPGKAKDHTAEYSCGTAGSARSYSPAEAGLVNHTLSCNTLASLGNETITITSATWGGNRGANNNIKLALASACDGRKLCEFSPLEVNSGVDPYPSMIKDMTVSYVCNGATKTLSSSAGQDGGKKVLSCS